MTDLARGGDRTPAQSASGFHDSFNCLWCGRAHRTNSPDDLEGWAMLCPDCVGRAQDNEFLRFRLRDGLRRRSARLDPKAGVPLEPQPVITEGEPTSTALPVADSAAEMLAYYAARAPEYDDFYLRRGRYDRGPLYKLGWDADMDTAATWLDALQISGEIVELAAGTGWWSPILAQKGELSLYDAIEGPLDLARQRLVAHHLRAHLHVRDAWEPPDRQVDALFTGFWLTHVERDRLADFMAVARTWLKPGGTFAFIDGLPDTGSSAIDHPPAHDEISVRRLNDGREFTIPKIYYTPTELEQALTAAGFAPVKVTTTSKFFLLGEATAA